MQKPDKRPFHKDLQTPMSPGRPEDYLSRRDEWVRRFKLLTEHYDIKWDNAGKWKHVLMVELALDFVPGLTEAPPEKRGRPRTRSTPSAREARRALLQAVEAKKQTNKHLSNLDACKAIEKDWSKAKPDHSLAMKPAAYLSRQIADARRERKEDEYRDALVLALLGGSPTE